MIYPITNDNYTKTNCQMVGLSLIVQYAKWPKPGNYEQLRKKINPC